MATTAELPVNGSYAQQGYDGSNYAATNNGPTYSASASQPAQSSGAAASEIPKDEVGWYFVEQYYTTLSRSPDKLHVSQSVRTPMAMADMSTALLQQALAVRLWK
jgi:hypothetical protein